MERISKIPLLLLLTLTMVLMVNCGGGDDEAQPPVLTSLSIEPNDASVTLGKLLQLKATGVYSDNSTREVTGETTWDCIDKNVATVDTAGLLTTAGIGSTHVSAEIGTIRAETNIIVSAVSLPVTGQTISYVPGDDGDMTKGVSWPSPRFVVGTGAEANCVTDELTGLMWVKALDTTKRTWLNALTYANGLSLCGHDDWRLPNVKELQSIINYGEDNTAVWLNGQGFSIPVSDALDDLYWTSTSMTANTYTNMAITVRLTDGLTIYNSKAGSLQYVFPVRTAKPSDAVPASVPKTGQHICYDQNGWIPADCAGTGMDGDLQAGVAWPSPRFVDNGDGTISDMLTGLIWLKNANCIRTDYPEYEPQTAFGTVSWQKAIEFVQGMNEGSYATCSAGYNDWRLPNIIELESLFNAENWNQADWLISQGFTSVEYYDRYSYWSSTTVPWSDHPSRSEMAYTFQTIIEMTDMWTKDQLLGLVWAVRGGNK